MSYRPCLAVFVAPLAVQAPGEAYLLSHPDTSDPGDVHEFAVTPDGSRAVYAATRPGEVRRLFSTRADGSPPALELTSVSPPLQDFRLVPDGSRVLARRSDEIRSYGVDGLGNSTIHLDADHDYQVAADSWRVVGAESDRSELWSNRVIGNELRRLSAISSVPGTVGEFAISPSGSEVAYTARVGGGDLALRLYLVPVFPAIGGTPYVEVGATPPGPGASNVVAFRFSPDGESLLYLADLDEDERFELHVTDRDGKSRRVSGPLVAGGDVGAFAFTPDGRFALYVADQREDERFELFAVPLGRPGIRSLDGAPLVASGALVAGGDVLDFEPAPDGERVVFRADAAADGAEELWVARIGRRAPPVRLNDPLLAQRDVRAGYRFDESGTRVLYLSDANVDEHDALFSVPLDRSRAPVRLNDPLAIGGDVAPDFRSVGGVVLYRAEQDANDVVELYVVPVDGGIPLELNAPLGAGRRVDSFAPAGDDVFYLANQDDARAFELYRAPLAGDEPPRRVTPRMVPPTTLEEVAPGGAHVLYSRDGRTFARRADASAPTTEVFGTTVSPDGTLVAFKDDLVVPGQQDLFVMSLDGGAPVRVTGTLLGPGKAIGSANPQFLFMPDSQSVLFAADAVTDGVYELWRAPVDGSAQPLRLNTQAVRQVDVSPDGTRVLFQASNLELRLAWTDGSGVSHWVDPSATGAMHGDFTSDGAYVIYDRDTPLPYGFFRAAVNAGTPARIDDDFSVTPDVSRIVYCVRSTSIPRLRVLSLPLATLSPETLLWESNLAVAGTVYSPDSRWLALLTGVNTADATRLWVVPVDGSAAPRRLNSRNDLLVESFAAAADSEHLFFAYRDGALFVSSLTTSAPEVQLTPDELPVDAFVVGSDSSTVLFSSGGAVYQASRTAPLVAQRISPLAANPHATIAGLAFASGEQRAVFSADLTFVDAHEVYGVLLH